MTVDRIHDARRAGSRPPEPPSPRRLPAVRIAALLLAGYGFCLVWLPFRGDQALMSLVGRDVLAGRRLYTEIFDAKQPGMYLWYGTVHWLFGPGQAVAQLMCVLVVVAVAAVVVALLSSRVQTPWVRAWLPVLVAGPLLLTLNEHEMGQLEILVCLPATASVALLCGRAGPTTTRAALAGTLLGLVAVFKTLLVVVPGIAVLVLLLLAGRRRWRLLAAAVAGAVVLPLCTLWWLAARGDLDSALYAWFSYPAQQLASSTRPLERLVLAVGRFGLLTAPFLLLAAYRLPTIWRRRDPLDIALLAWLIVGTAAYLVQVWWSYYLIILLPPLVVLALRQLDDFVAGRTRSRRTALVLLAALAVPLVAYGSVNASRTVADGAGLTQDSRDRIAERTADYVSFRQEIAASSLRPGDSLYVLGDPRWQEVADRPIPLVTNGWSVGQTPPQRWQRLADELRRIRPAVVFVDTESARAVAIRGPVFRVALEELYVVSRQSSFGTWYRLSRATG